MSQSPFTTSKRGLIQIKPQTPKALLAPLNSSRHDSSITLLPNELSRLLDQSQRQLSHNNSSAFYDNFNLTAGDGMTVSERSILDDSHLVHSLKEKTNLLFPQFLEVLQARTNDSEVFDTIQDLIQTCAGVADELHKERQMSAAAATRGQRDNGLWLDQEMKTWKLLYALYKDRIIVQAESGGMDCEMPPLGGSEKEVIAQLYACNSTLREYQLMVDWLEACYNRNDAQPQVGHVTSRAVGWENTLFQLQNRRDVAFGTGAEIVKSLDPDAPIRERRPLHALDEEDNLRLSSCIFAEIRQGHIDEAMALCKYSGQTWRAAILEGWRLHEDPNYETQLNTREKLPIEGNPRRDIWKKCAWLMADSKKFDEYTRAIAGAFCGHLDSMKALLNGSWEDLLWAYLKVQIDIRVETEIRACCMKVYQPLPDGYWNAKMSLEQIFEELSVSNDAAVRDYAGSKIGTIQKYLILDNIGELLQHMRRWVEESSSNVESEKLSPHLLRFLTHIVLFMRQIGRIDKEETADRIVAAYVDALIEMGDAQLVAFYTAALPSKMQIYLYSKFLEAVTETTARSAALTEAINAGLDVENITRHTVETIRQRMPSEGDEATAAREKLQVGIISAYDQRKISALEWLTFLPTQRGDLLWQGNAMIRTFLGENKSECVRAVYEIIPNDSLSQIISVFGSKDNLPCREECSIKEYLSYKVYLTAIDSFSDWSRLLHNQPKEPQLITAGANFTERIASEHKEQVYRAELKRWEANLEEQTKLTRDALFNILLFPEKGWLIDPNTPKDPVNISQLDWENRQIQLDKLRSICIPEVVLLLHKVLHVSGDYQGCVKLSDEIASEGRQLYKVYTKHKLAELLSKLAESSLELLNKKLDPWGYATTL